MPVDILHALSSWHQKGVPDTQSREDKEASREAAEEIADTFPICQPEGARVRRELATCQGVRETSMMEGDLFTREMASR